MTVNAILAHDSFWGIGKNGDLPWPKNSEDLKWFKDSTHGGVVVMGRKTWESLPVKPLPKRKNIVVSSSTIEGADITVKLDQLKRITIPMLETTSDIWIIGGAQLIEQCLDIIDELWLNNVEGVYNCDTFLPKQKITELFYPASTEKKSFGIITKWVKR